MYLWKYTHKLKKTFCKKKNNLYCICFHDIGALKSPFSITEGEFEKIIVELKKYIVSVKDIRREEWNSQNKKVIISFDDGYESLINTAFPILQKYSIPFVAYITTDFLDNEGYLTKKELKTIANSTLCTIGSHMCSHKKTKEMSRYQVKQEWEESKSIIEKIISKDVQYAALPYGSFESCTYRSCLYALQAGYVAVATTVAESFEAGEKIYGRYVYQNDNNRIDNLLSFFNGNLS